MYNGMKVPCPKCNPKGHKSEDKEKYISYKPICEICFGTHYLDWLELAKGGKTRSFSTTKLWFSSGSTSSIGVLPESLKDKKNKYLRANPKGVKQNWIKQ
jgi:hypothetical protein